MLQKSEQAMIMSLLKKQNVQKRLFTVRFFTHSDFRSNGTRFYNTMKRLEGMGFVTCKVHDLYGKGWRLTSHGEQLAKCLEDVFEFERRMKKHG